jgi:hypothetical protein
VDISTLIIPYPENIYLIWIYPPYLDRKMFPDENKTKQNKTKQNKTKQNKTKLSPFWVA